MSKTSSHAFAEERRAAIMSLLDRNSSVQVTELSKAFDVSVVTIRNDLDALQADGKLRRTHGGAVALHKALKVSVQDKRINLNAEAKRAIARAAVQFVHDGDTIIVDSGTTALEFVRALDSFEDITVITADISIADYIDQNLPSVDAIVLGGMLRKEHRYLHGMLALRSLEVLHADLSVVCPGAFVANRGFMTDYPQMAQLKQAFLTTGARSLALMDSSKTQGSGLIRFAELHEVDVIVMNEDPLNIVSEAIDGLADGIARPQLILAGQQTQ